MESHAIKRFFGLVILAAVVSGGFYFFFKKKEQEKIITYSTSDAKNLKGQISIALDSWIGYFPFRSPVFGNLMRKAGFRIKIIDDRADYASRMKMLKKGRINFAVCTVDSYILNGAPANFPGVIVMIIDESKGGDALVSRSRTIRNIDQLKRSKNFKIAFTPGSPSEHLLKSLAVHFDVPILKIKDAKWRVEVNGAKEAYNKLKKGEVALAALWEPYVAEAKSLPGATKIIGSEDMDKLIVDILLVSRQFAKKSPQLVKLFLKNYFETLNMYNAAKTRLKQDIMKTYKVTNRQVTYMLRGVKWKNYPENLQWYGLTGQTTFKQPLVVASIKSTVEIFLGIKDFTSNPIPDKDPYTLLNSSYLKDLYNINTYKRSTTSEVDTLTKRFSRLSTSGWNRLKVVGALKLRPITFRTGTFKLDENGKKQLNQIVQNIRHYPNFRIFVKGHTGLRGDPEANMKLSLQRAKAVKKELQFTFNIHTNRIRYLGFGSKEPLSKQVGESDRSYNNRLKRVEILFVK